MRNYEVEQAGDPGEAGMSVYEAGTSVYFAILSIGGAVFAAFLLALLIAWAVFVIREKRR